MPQTTVSSRLHLLLYLTVQSIPCPWLHVTPGCLPSSGRQGSDIVQFTTESQPQEIAINEHKESKKKRPNSAVRQQTDDRMRERPPHEPVKELMNVHDTDREEGRGAFDRNHRGSRGIIYTNYVDLNNQSTYRRPKQNKN